MSDSSSPNVYRDGGGGGKIGGKNIMVFSDTTTTAGGAQGSMKGFTSNSIVYVRQPFRCPWSSDYLMSIIAEGKF